MTKSPTIDVTTNLMQARFLIEKAEKWREWTAELVRMIEVGLNQQKKQVTTNP